MKICRNSVYANDLMVLAAMSSCLTDIGINQKGRLANKKLLLALDRRAEGE
jgi:hypothetical protein